jgi:hypothetical protein
VYGTDLRQSFIDLGYDLFQDRTAAPRMIAADFLADSAASSASSPSLTALEGRFEIIHACSFFHVFSRDEQLRACTRALRLLHDKPGSFVFGTQPGGEARGEPRDDPREDAAKRCWHSKEWALGSRWRRRTSRRYPGRSHSLSAGHEKNDALDAARPRLSVLSPMGWPRSGPIGGPESVIECLVTRVHSGTIQSMTSPLAP